MNLPQNNQITGKLKLDVFYLSVISLLTVVVWVGFSVYQSLSKNTVDASVQKLITQINPNLDTEAFYQFQKTRVTPPEEFQIITYTRQNNQPLRATLDPFNNKVEVLDASSAAKMQEKTSDSVSLVKPDSEMIP